ncbi:MAG: hypothetical protein HY747_09215 [Elusimicrobia bacterium]|nr:hypothetical protein [Elusimicrobiota bacterium]
MTVILVSCAVVVTIAFGVAVVYLVLTLRQARRTAAAAEQFLLHADETASMINESSKKITSYFNGAQRAWGRFAPLVTGIVWALNGKFFQKEAAKNEEQEGRP